MKKAMIIASICLLLIPSMVFASVSLECPDPLVPSIITAGETYEIPCKVENTESEATSAYLRLNISETMGESAVLTGDFKIIASLNGTSLKCTENDNGDFSCFNGLEEYLFDKAKYSLSLNVTSEPNLIPSDYAFTLSLLTTKVGVDNPNVTSTQTTSNTTTGELTSVINLTTTTNTEERTNVTVSIPNSNKKINLSLTVKPNTTRQIVTLENELIISPENATVNNVSYGSSLAGSTTTKTLSIDATAPTGTQEMLVYVDGLGEPTQIVITTPTGFSMTLTSSSWAYDDATKILKFNATFASPISTVLKWITTAPSAPAAPASSGGGGGGGIAPSVSARVLSPLASIEQSATSASRYAVDIENTGTADAAFRLEIGGLPAGYYTVSDPVTIPVIGGNNKRGTLYYTLTLPADATDKTFTVSVKGTAGLLSSATSYSVSLKVLSAAAGAATTTTTVPATGITLPSIPGIVIPTDAISGAFVSLSERNDVRIAAGGVAAAAIAVFAVRTFARRRTPWRNDYYKPKFQAGVLEGMKKQVKRRFADEDWVRKL